MTTHPTPPFDWTYAEYARFPDDGNRYEVLDGEVLVTPAPSPRHQHIVLRLSLALHTYVDRHDLGIVLPDVDLLFESGHFLRPDIVFVPRDRLHGITDRGVEVAPALIVEVLSPTSASIDRVKKPRRYRDFGVPEYWVADPQAGELLVWRFGEGALEPARVTGRLEWRPAGTPEPLVLETGALFRPM
jgi:Uma2 family endonuclease